MSQEELSKLFLRVQETRNDELPGFLSAILPVIIPLTNQEALRNDAIKVITECLRRAKLASIKLPLDLFVSLLQPKYLPFGCNFAIAFLDGLSDIQCISDISATSVQHLIESWINFELFSYQSNSVSVYLMKFNSFIPEALQLISSPQIKMKAIEFLCDYFLDVLFYLPTSIGNSIVSPGLSQARIQRLQLKQKNFTAMTLMNWKLQVTELSSQLIGPMESKLLIGLVASYDKLTSNNDLQSFGKKLINQVKEQFLKDKSSATEFQLTLILQFLMSGTKAFGANPPIYLLSKDRVSLPKELQTFIFEYIQKNLDWLPLPSTEEMIAILVEHAAQSVSSQSEANDRLLKVVSQLLLDIFERLPSSDASHLTPHIPVLLNQIKPILSRYAYSSNLTLNHQTTAALDVKNHLYDLVFLFITKYQYSLDSLLTLSESSSSSTAAPLTSNTNDILSLFLTIAISDFSTGSSTLFKVLDAIEERWNRDLCK